MVDSEGLCTVKVDGARVGISYDIIVNTPELMRLVNHGVELSKNEEKLNCRGVWSIHTNTITRF